MDIENDVLTISNLLNPQLGRLLSGWLSKRNVLDHHAVTGAIWVYFKTHGDMKQVEAAVLNPEVWQSEHYRRLDSDEFRKDNDFVYSNWHEASRGITDFMIEKNYEYKPEYMLILDLMDHYTRWYQTL